MATYAGTAVLYLDDHRQWTVALMTFGRGIGWNAFVQVIDLGVSIPSIEAAIVNGDGPWVLLAEDGVWTVAVVLEHDGSLWLDQAY